MARMIQCVRLKKEAEGLDYPPYPGPIGIKLYEQVSKVAWKEWRQAAASDQPAPSAMVLAKRSASVALVSCASLLASFEREQ